jgi:hypothetical protein
LPEISFDFFFLVKEEEEEEVKMSACQKLASPLGRASLDSHCSCSLYLFKRQRFDFLFFFDEFFGFFFVDFTAFYSLVGDLRNFLSLVCNHFCGFLFGIAFTLRTLLQCQQNTGRLRRRIALGGFTHKATGTQVPILRLRLQFLGTHKRTQSEVQIYTNPSVIKKKKKLK